MFTLLAEGAQNAGNSLTQWILPAVLLVLVIGIFIMNYFRSKKNKENAENMVNNIKVGDKVKTYSGFYGEIVSITETTDGKVAVLRTGEEGHYGYLSIDMNAIYAIDEKKPVVLDENGNIIDETATEAAPAVEEQPAEQPAEEVVVEEVAGETPKEDVKPAKKPRTKKAKKADNE